MVAEGFLLLADPATLGMFDAVFFLEAPGEVCLARRLVRAPAWEKVEKRGGGRPEGR